MSEPRVGLLGIKDTRQRRQPLWGCYCCEKRRVGDWQPAKGGPCGQNHGDGGAVLLVRIGGI